MSPRDSFLLSLLFAGGGVPKTEGFTIHVEQRPSPPRGAMPRGRHHGDPAAAAVAANSKVEVRDREGEGGARAPEPHQPVATASATRSTAEAVARDRFVPVLAPLDAKVRESSLLSFPSLVQKGMAFLTKTDSEHDIGVGCGGEYKAWPKDTGDDLETNNIFVNPSKVHKNYNEKAAFIKAEAEDAPARTF